MTLKIRHTNDHALTAIFPDVFNNDIAIHSKRGEKYTNNPKSLRSTRKSMPLRTEEFYVSTYT